MNTKIEDLINASKLNELVHKKQVEEQKKTTLVWFLAIVGAVATVAAIAYAVYRYFTPDYLADLDDDIDDDLDDDFFDDLSDDSDDETVEETSKKAEEEAEVTAESTEAE